MSDLISVWEKSQTQIQERVGKASYETWFSAIQVKEKTPGILTVETPDDFFRAWIVDHYQRDLQEILDTTAQRPVSLEFSVNTTILSADPQTRLARLEQNFTRTEGIQSVLNARFTFDNFVIGPSNRFACAASLAVAESPAKAYNPLFIYGRVGLGKTHLIQAITHRIRQLYPAMKHCYMSSEQFTNELINAIRNRSTSQFRKKYREIDVLLIDDVQFIAGKESTQEEFFHTFNALHDNRKQIIITSDRPPKEITNLEERLSSRFAWGLAADIQPPDYETRVAILRKKIKNEAIQVPDDVIHFIAAQIKTNIRELEGALIRVAAYSLLEEKPVTLDVAVMTLKDMVRETARAISVDMIQKTVAEFFRVPPSELRAKRRTRNIVLPRQIAMYLSRQLTAHSLPEIGTAFGGKDHTTVLHSCKKIEQSLIIDREIKNIIDQLLTTLQR